MKASSSGGDDAPDNTIQAILEDQSLFESARSDLAQLIATARDTTFIPTETADGAVNNLGEIHHDYNLMDGRRYLEVTGKEAEARGIIEELGSGARLRRAS